MSSELPSTSSPASGSPPPSSKTYEELEREYEANLSRIRSFLAGTRSRSTLQESERLLGQAKQCAIQIQEVASRAGDGVRAADARNRLVRDVTPLSNEIRRALNDMGREEIMYRPPTDDLESGEDGQLMMESLVRSSDDMLRESQGILSETEQIGTSTLYQMGQQREQLMNAQSHVVAVQEVAIKAKQILQGMSRKALRSKVFLYLLIAGLASANMYVLYLIYQKHFGKKNNN